MKNVDKGVHEKCSRQVKQHAKMRLQNALAGGGTKIVVFRAVMDDVLGPEEKKISRLKACTFL